jgi:hypothetical protein
MPAQESSRRKIDIFALAIILALGILLRIPPHAFSPRNPSHSIAALHLQPAFTQIGPDEVLYRRYVNALVKDGITSYPDLVEAYNAEQNELPYAILPPVRFLYIFSGYVRHSLFGDESLEALRSALAVGCADCGPDHFLEKCAPTLSISQFAQPRHAADAAMKLIAALPR